MKKIVFLDEYSIAGRSLEKITSQGEYVAYENTAKCDVVERLKDADIAITNKVVIDGEAMRQLPKLKLICIAATGMNNVDLEAAKELGIEVKNAVGYSTTSAFAVFSYATYSPCDVMLDRSRPAMLYSSKKTIFFIFTLF